MDDAHGREDTILLGPPAVQLAVTKILSRVECVRGRRKVKVTICLACSPIFPRGYRGKVLS